MGMTTQRSGSSWITRSRIGGTFFHFRTEYDSHSTNYSFYLPSQSRNVNAILAQGSIEKLQRNDQYGVFTATYTWDAYFDPSRDTSVGYGYTEHDTDLQETGFTYTDNPVCNFYLAIN